MAIYSITYNFNPNDPMWIVDADSVKKATCIQSEIKIAPLTKTTYTTIVQYIVLLDCNEGTMTVPEDNAFDNLDDALLALKTKVTTGC